MTKQIEDMWRMKSSLKRCEASVQGVKVRTAAHSHVSYLSKNTPQCIVTPKPRSVLPDFGGPFNTVHSERLAVVALGSKCQRARSPQPPKTRVAINARAKQLLELQPDVRRRDEECQWLSMELLQFQPDLLQQQPDRKVGSCWGRLILPGAFVACPGNVGSPRSIRWGDRWGEHPSLPTW